MTVRATELRTQADWALHAPSWITDELAGQWQRWREMPRARLRISPPVLELFSPGAEEDAEAALVLTWSTGGRIAIAPGGNLMDHAQLTADAPPLSTLADAFLEQARTLLLQAHELNLTRAKRFGRIKTTSAYLEHLDDLLAELRLREQILLAGPLRTFLGDPGGVT